MATRRAKDFRPYLVEAARFCEALLVFFGGPRDEPGGERGMEEYGGAGRAVGDSGQGAGVDGRGHTRVGDLL